MNTADGSAFRGAVRRLLPSRVERRYLFLLPLAVFEVIGFVIPFLILARISFTAQSMEAPYAAGTWTISSFVAVASSGLLQYVVGFSVFYAAVTTAIALTISVFYAYAAWRATGLTKAVLLFASILPLLTTLAVKTYTWLPLLSPNGTLNQALLALQLVEEPLRLSPGLVGAVVGQVYNMVPFGILPIYSVLGTMDWEKVEAARDLGAHPVRAFYEIVLPHIVPGIAVASVIFITWGLGAYAAPTLLGSGPERPFALEIGNLLLQNFNWSLSAALSVVMLFIGGVAVAIVLGLLNRTTGGVRLVE